MVLFFSCPVGSQSSNRVMLAVVVWIIVAACTTITDDIKFSYLGFGILLASQLGETSKTVFQEFILNGVTWNWIH